MPIVLDNLTYVAGDGHFYTFDGVSKPIPLGKEVKPLMKTEAIKVSYRDKETASNVSLGTIDAPRFDTVAEAVAYFNQQEEGKGEEVTLDYIHTAHDIELQRKHRDANRPDKPKEQSNLAKFKQLSPEKQEEALRALGLLQ